MTIAPPTIQTENCPPERYAARMIGEMCRWLIDKRGQDNERMMAQLETMHSRLGTPKAQKKFVDRMRKACGKGIIELELATGTRGRFKMLWTTWDVVTPITGESIEDDAPIPERPWLSCEIDFFDGRTTSPRNHNQYRAFLMSHHAMQRLAERCNAKTPDDLLDALREIWFGMKPLLRDAMANKDDPKTKVIWKIPAAGGVAILERTKDNGFVVKTVVPDNGGHHELSDV